MATDHNYYVYIMSSITKKIYIGVTSNLQKRIQEHIQGKYPGFSKKYKCYKLVYFEHFTDVNYAIKREKELKGWKRIKKVALIEIKNPTWQNQVHMLFR